ncbi:MAG: flagellar filament capping protein FliD [Phycisphaerae bacterium]
MGRISASTGLISGINHKDVIDQLMSIESRPKTLLQGRVDSVNQQKLAYADLSTRLASIKLFGTSIKKPQTFGAAKTTSSDENVLTATAANGAAIGAFQFQVARLTTTQQAVSRGFSDVSSRVGAGTVTIEMGGGEISTPTQLSQLRGGAGVRRGQFRITDGAGKSAVIEVGASVTLDDVLKKINTSLDINVKAAVSGDRITLTDKSGATTVPFAVEDLADGHAAEDLGLTGTAAVAGVITGADINHLGRANALSGLNDGRGVRRAGEAGGDFTVTSGDGSWTVSLANARSLGDVFDAISDASGGKVTASVDPGSNAIKLTGNGTVTVAEANNSKAATDLGIVGSGAGGLTGGALIAGLNTVLLASLNGGQGLALGNMKITNAAGASATVDLSAARSVQDVFDTINAAGLNITASYNTAGNGIQLTDRSTGTGALKVEEDGAGTTAAALGLLGTAAAGTTTLAGKNLQRQWVSENMLLADYNGGKGVSSGRFQITNSKGNTVNISVDPSTKQSLGDVIRDINNRASFGVTASINAQGDGLLLTDSAGGTLKMKVENVDGTTATDLNIAGAATATTIDGSFEKSVTFTATDTIAQAQQKLAELNFGVVAQVINDGSEAAPYRLSLTAKNAGRNARVVFDAGTTTLGARNLVEAQDAAVFLVSPDNPEPLLVTSGKNQLAGVIKGVTIDLLGVSDKPVTLSVTRDSEKLTEQAGKFVEDFNGVITKIKELTKFDPETNEKGLLLGDATVRTVEANMFAVLNTRVASGGKYRILADVGIKLGEGSQLEFDQDKFTAAFADDPDAVQRLFATAQEALGDSTPTSQLNNGRGLRTLGPGKPDFKLQFRDGTSVDVTLGTPTSLKEVIDTINSAALGKAKVELRDDGKGLTLTDLTGSATTALKLTPLSASQSLLDLRLNGTPTGNTLAGGQILNPSASNATSGGIGFAIESIMNKLVDPVNGVVSRENKTLDGKSMDFQKRITQLDKILETKRTRLEAQFANLESVLAGLQSQQASLGQIQNISAAK